MPVSTRSPAPDSLHGAIAALQRLADVFARRREQLARQVGLTDQQWRVLEEIARPGFLPSMFARHHELHAAAVSRVLRQLQSRELVEAAISPGDGRRREYRLTRSGRRVLERLARHRGRAIDAVWRELPPRELRRFADFSGELADRLEQYAAGVEAGAMAGAGSPK